MSTQYKSPVVGRKYRITKGLHHGRLCVILDTKTTRYSCVVQLLDAWGQPTTTEVIVCNDELES